LGSGFDDYADGLSGVFLVDVGLFDWWGFDWWGGINGGCVGGEREEIGK